jgi:hypothetical protein
MQSPAARRRIAIAAPATPVAGTATPLPPMRFTMANGLLEIQDAAIVVELLKNQQAVEAQARADAIMQSVVYRVDGEANPNLPFNGLLTERLQISERSVRELIATGRLGYFCAAKKAYRSSERDVRRFEAGLPPAQVNS